MTRSFARLAIVAMAIAPSSAFVANGSRKRTFLASHQATSVAASLSENMLSPTDLNTLYFAEKVSPIPSPSPAESPKTSGKEAPKASTHKEGILSPVVLLAKQSLGDKMLNKLRADAISLHSDIIGNFVRTADTDFGKGVLKLTFQVADKDGNGTIEEDELAAVLQSLGFDWLKDKQIKGIFERADLDKNGAIDFEEWLKEAPKTLRTNLVKLAKKNGGDLGLLA